MNNQQLNSSYNNKLDLSPNINRITLGVSFGKFWGVETSYHRGVCQPINGAILDSDRGDDRHVQGLSSDLHLKSIVTVGDGFSNSPITMGIISKSKYIPFLVVKLSRFQLTEPPFLTLTCGELFMINPKLQEQLIEAARAGNIIAMKNLVRSGANPFAIDWEGESAITIIASQDTTEGSRIIEELVSLTMEVTNEK